CYFILAGLGIALDTIPAEGRDLFLAGAVIASFAKPILFGALERWSRTVTKIEPAAKAAEPEALAVTQLSDHAIVVGYGRVGQVVAEGLQKDGHPFLVIEERKETADLLRKAGIEVLQGNAVSADLLNAANLIRARWMFVAIPDGFEAGQVVGQARNINEGVPIVARAHSDAEVEHLMAHGATFTIMGEREIGLGMLGYAYGRP